MKINKLTVELSEDEVNDLIYDSVEDIESDESGRWSREITSIVPIENGGKTVFAEIPWQRGLTEMQENEYTGGEFPLVKEVKTIGITKSTMWVPIDYEGEQVSKNDVNSIKMLASKKDIQNEEKILSGIDFQKQISALKKLSLLNLTPTTKNLVDILEKFNSDKEKILRALKD
jgi:hypothetical protein